MIPLSRCLSRSGELHGSRGCLAPANAHQLCQPLLHGSTCQPPLVLLSAAAMVALPSCPISLDRVPALALQLSGTSSCWDATSSSGDAARNRVSARMGSTRRCAGGSWEWEMYEQGSPPCWDRLLVPGGEQWVVCFQLLRPYSQICL